MIDIVLATYNGEKYINTQISSIINQTFTDWHLFIHDDGSSDNTINILENFAKTDLRIQIIYDNVVGLGPGKNFLHTLKYCTADFICFADQDDFWFENKLETLHMAIKKTDHNKPIIIVSDALAWYYPENSVFKISNYGYTFYPRHIDEILFIAGGLQGCATIFNKVAMKYLIKDYNYLWMHDHLLVLIALCFGEILYVKKPLMLYRQHNSNVTPRIKKKLVDLFTDKIKNVKIPVVYEPAYLDIKEFYRIYEDELPEKYRNSINNFLSFPTMHPLKRFIKILFSNYTIGNSNHISLIIKLILRKTFIGS